MAEDVAYKLDGPEGAPPLVLAGSLGTTVGVWDGQVPVLSQWFRVVRVEHPGHGGAGVPEGPGTLEGLGERLLGIMDDLGIGAACYAGLSLGGLVGMWLAANHPERVSRLALCFTSARFAGAGSYMERAAQVRSAGTAQLAPAALGRWFTAPFLSLHPEVGEGYAATLAGIDAPGYAYCCEALAGADLTAHLERIKAPTLVVGGALDPVVPPDLAAMTMKAIPGASLVVLPAGAHLANVERPGPFNDLLLSHFVGSASERGERVRREVLGGGHVDRERAAGAGFGAPFQDLLAKWPWGEIWARPGLDWATRRLLTIAMLASLGRTEELEVHLRAALARGEGGEPLAGEPLAEAPLTEEAVTEVLLQVAVYAGVPAANAAFRVAGRVLGDAPAK